MTDKEQPALQVKDLRKDFRRTRALKGINITLDGPGVYGFLGPNGAGKTTTFKLICGLLKPTGGSISIDGENILTRPLSVLTKLGVQFDGPVFYPHLSGRDNLRVVACWLGENLDGRIGELLDLVDLSGAADRGAGEYSFGMKRRLGLASALLSDPRLLLLDEPTSGLDPGGIADVRRLLPRLAHDEGRCVFLSSHRMEEVEQICDRVFIIHHGEIVADGKPKDLASEDNLIEIQCDQATSAKRILEGLADILQVRQLSADQLEVLAPGIRASRINQFLIDQGITAEQIVKRRESLENVFFRLTGRGNGDGNPSDTSGESGGVS